MPLSDTAIRILKLRAKPYKMYDRDGLFLLVNPGGSKLWRWRYRFTGKEKVMAAGRVQMVADFAPGRDSGLRLRFKVELLQRLVEVANDLFFRDADLALPAFDHGAGGGGHCISQVGLATSRRTFD